MPRTDSRRPSYGVYFDVIALGLLFLAVMGVLVFVWPFLWYVWVPVLGLPALYFVVLVPWRSRDAKKIEMREAVIAKAPPAEGSRILDVGTGRGLMAIGYARAATNVEVIGTDIFSNAFILGNRPSKARLNAEIEGVADRVRFEKGSATDIPFPDGHFDIVASSMVIHNFFRASEMEKAFREAARVLKPGGRFVYVDFVHRSDHRALLARFPEMDLEIRDTFPLSLGAKAYIAQKAGREGAP